MYIDDDFVPVDECAARLQISQQRVLDLVANRTLRHCYDGSWLLVQPAIVSGAT